MMTVTYIMHQSRHTTNKIGVEIFNLKVIDKHRLIKNHNFEAEYGRGSSVKVVDLIALSKIASGNPTLAYHIEWVVCCCVNIALIGVEAQNLINRMNINLCNGLKLGFSSFNIIRPYLVTDFNLVNTFLPFFNCYKRIACKACLPCSFDSAKE